MSTQTIDLSLTAKELKLLGRALREYRAHLAKLPVDYPLLDETAGERVFLTQGIHDRIVCAYFEASPVPNRFTVDTPPNDTVNEVY